MSSLSQPADGVLQEVRFEERRADLVCHDGSAGETGSVPQEQKGQAFSVFFVCSRMLTLLSLLLSPPPPPPPLSLYLTLYCKVVKAQSRTAVHMCACAANVSKSTASCKLFLLQVFCDVFLAVL